MFMKQEQKIKTYTSKKYFNLISLPSYKSYKIYSPPKYNGSLHIYFHFLLHIAKGNYQESEGGGGGKALLYLEKSTLKVATSVMSSSKNCPRAA